jgi:hypothetical protein
MLVAINSCPVLRASIKLKLSYYMPQKCLGGEEVSSYSFLTSALDEGVWPMSHLATL